MCQRVSSLPLMLHHPLKLLCLETVWGPSTSLPQEANLPSITSHRYVIVIFQSYAVMPGPVVKGGLGVEILASGFLPQNSQNLYI